MEKQRLKIVYFAQMVPEMLRSSGAGFGAGLYRNLVRIGAIQCNTP